MMGLWQRRTDPTVSPTVSYTYRVRAVNGAGASDWTNAVRLTTDTPPAAPTGLTASVDTKTQVTLTWTSHSNNEYAFAIWRQGGGSDWARVGVVPPQTTRYSDRGLTPGASYRYRVRATNRYASDWSNAVEVVMVTPPAAPSDLAASASAGAAVTLTWTSHSDNENAFVIWRTGGGSDWTRV